ncbi:unnamed protein product [Calicophoron daubneyi]|uniref:SCP domain-containing protein n=1 Tax=Calicophoron daubneyi TaxID=300641 RepID=A0AAV2TLH1_CALDB
MNPNLLGKRLGYRDMNREIRGFITGNALYKLRSDRLHQPLHCLASIKPSERTEEQKKELEAYAESVKDAHNELRAKHGSPPLTLEPKLSALAQKWADHLVTQPSLANSGYTYEGQRVGENVFSRTSNIEPKCDSKELVEHWYQEKSKYHFYQEPVLVTGIGGFTQLVWAGSQKIGVGKAVMMSGSGQTAANKLVVVCMYYPPGNVKGQFLANVKRAA